MRTAVADGVIDIPLIELGTAGPVELFRREQARARALVAAGRHSYGALPFALADRLSRRWLARSDHPYRGEIDAIAAALGGPGAHLLNLSFEWGCTSGALPDGDGVPRLLRVLDWPLDGLGRHVVVARRSVAAGTLIDVTWPGATGIVTALAPGRFAAAMNQAPREPRGLGFVGDWLVNRVALLRSAALPPAHLLRQVCENAPDFATARRLLAETPVAIGAIFILAGTRPGESCVIERRPAAARIHDGEGAAAANAWLADGWAGVPRGADNPGRRRALLAVNGEANQGFGWLVPPMLNPRTRLAVRASAATGTLAVLGIENEKPATSVFSLAA